MNSLREKFWLWGQSPNTHIGHLGTPSRMTALEGCAFFGIDRCCRVVMLSQPRPPFDQESLALQPLKEVVWSVTGACGTVEHNDGCGDLEEVLRQVGLFSNITGGVLDDFFVSPERRQAFPPERLHQIRERLHTGTGTPLKLWMVVYATNLEPEIAPYLEACDVLSFWSWQSEQLPAMERNFDRLRELAPGKEYLTGCYLFDYGNNRPLRMEDMKFQAAQYQKWLCNGESDGLIICSNCCADIGLDTVPWTRDWLRELGQTPED